MLNDGIEVVLLTKPIGTVHGEEPPQEIAEALKTADIALLLTTMSLTHTKAREIACSKYGTRVASMPGITADIIKRAIELDYADLKQRIEEIQNRLSKGKKLEVRTDNGTHLVMSIGIPYHGWRYYAAWFFDKIRGKVGRPGVADHGLFTTPGAWGNLPAGEAYIAPCEGTANGVLVVDGSMPFVGKLDSSVKLIIKDGFVNPASLPEIIRKKIKPYGKIALGVAEFGIGLNPKAEVRGIPLEDEKAGNTAHLAIGSNQDFGGAISSKACPSHLDFIFRNPTIFIDDKELILDTGTNLTAREAMSEAMPPAQQLMRNALPDTLSNKSH